MDPLTMEKQGLKTALDKYLIKLLCQSVASGLELQGAREYWSNQEGTVQATVLHELNPKLPKNNLCAEKCLAKFVVHLASESARHSNKLFKGKRIRNDLTLNTTEESTENLSLKSLKNIFKSLDSIEVERTLEQRELSKKRVAKSMGKSKRGKESIDLFFKKCKEHGGSITTLKELNLFLKSTHKEDKKKFLRQEVQFQKITPKKDSIQRSELYKLNGLTLQDVSVNLAAPCPRHYHR